jgi:uncharacterized protein
MKRVFADTFYYLALLNANDEAHARATQLTVELRATIVTTDFVITELADALCESGARGAVIPFIDAPRADPDVRIDPATRELLERAWQLYRARLDKAWSLTDCTSFAVMRQLRLSTALTGDRHFLQAGFRALLK